MKTKFLTNIRDNNNLVAMIKYCRQNFGVRDDTWQFMFYGARRIEFTFNNSEYAMWFYMKFADSLHPAIIG
jgi:hypothetical protein